MRGWAYVASSLACSHHDAMSRRFSSALDYVDTVTGRARPRAMFAGTVVDGTSRDFGWDGVAAEYGRSREFEPEGVAMTGHYLAINLACTPLVMEVKNGGRCRKELLPPNSFWIAPA